MADARRIKRVRNLTGALAKLLSLAPVQVKIDLTEPLFTADFITQDLAKIFPEMVFKAKPTDNGTDPLPVDTTPGQKGWYIDGIIQLIPWIIAAFKEQNDDITDLKKKILKRANDVDAALAVHETRITDLEAKVLALQTALANIGTTP